MTNKIPNPKSKNVVSGHSTELRVNSESRNPGISLLIAVIFVGALMIIVVGLAETTINAIRDSRDYHRILQARYASQGMLNAAMQKALKGPRGAEINMASSSAESFLQGVLCGQPSSGRQNTACLSGSFMSAVNVMSKASAALKLASENLYSTPAAFTKDGKVKGTGSVSETCEYDMDGDDDVDNDDYKSADNPCHWNKLYPNEKHDLPLYYEESGGIVKNPKDTNLSKIYLRARTPCQKVENGELKYIEWCKGLADPKWPGERPKLYPFGDPDKERMPEEDENIMLWQISADVQPYPQFSPILYPIPLKGPDEDIDSDTIIEKKIHAQYRDCTERYIEKELEDKGYRVKCNTVLYASALQYLIDNENLKVLTEQTVGQDIAGLFGKIINFLTNQTELDPKNSTGTEPIGFSYARNNAKWGDRTLNAPFLQIYLAEPPADTAWDASQTVEQQLKHYIPYLEYQLLTDKQVADEKIFGQTEVKVSDFTQKSQGIYEFETQTPFTAETLDWE